MAGMQISVAAIRGGRLQPLFARPSSHQRVRSLGLSPVGLSRGRARSARTVREGGAPLRRPLQMTWTRTSATLRRGRAVHPAAPWRG